MNRQQLNAIVASFVYAGLILLLSRGGLVVIALVIIGLRELYGYFTAKQSGWSAIAALAPRWLVGASFAILIALLPKPLTQVALGLAYGGWLWWYMNSFERINESAALIIAGVEQFAGLSAIFLAAAFWHWSNLLVLPLVWGVSYVVADGLLARGQERARPVLAATWALVASECAWIFSAWLVNYILLNGYLIIPQAAVVLTALGYCFGGIYTSHLSNRLNRNRLLEYLAIGLLLLIIVIYGTKWNGVI